MKYLEHHIGTFAERRVVGRVDRSLFRESGIELGDIVCTRLHQMSNKYWKGPIDWQHKTPAIFTRQGLNGGSNRRPATSIQSMCLKNWCIRIGSPSATVLPRRWFTCLCTKPEIQSIVGIAELKSPQCTKLLLPLRVSWSSRGHLASDTAVNSTFLWEFSRWSSYGSRQWTGA